LITSKTNRRSNGRRAQSQQQPVSSVYCEYRNNDGSRSSVSISSNSHPLMQGMMPIMMQGVMPQVMPSMMQRIMMQGMMPQMMPNNGMSNIQNQFDMDLMDTFDLLPGMDSVLQTFLRSFTDTGEMRDPLSTDVFDTFKEVPFNELKNHTKIEVTDNCSICLSGFTENEKEENKKALVIPCGHYFHKSCIKEWLTKCYYKCPLCKRSCDPSRKDSEEKSNDDTSNGSRGNDDMSNDRSSDADTAISSDEEEEIYEYN